MVRPLQLQGMKFGRLTVVSEAQRLTKGPPRWHCECDCGGATESIGYLLTCGRIKSCGCLKTDACREPKNLKHGGVGSYHYRAWSGMKSRCYNSGNPGFPSYGGRGIRVCQRWLDSFEDFRRDVGERPSAKHSIDRIDVNGDYAPDNCRWATAIQQTHNRRCSISIEHDGREMMLLEACKLTGVNYKTAKWRISQGRPWDQCRYTTRRQS